MIVELCPFTYIVTDGALYLTYEDGTEAEYGVSVNGIDQYHIVIVFDEEQPFVRAGTD